MTEEHEEQEGREAKDLVVVVAPDNYLVAAAAVQSIGIKNWCSILQERK